MPFNGGKMEHIFTMDPDDQNRYKSEFSSEAAQEALVHGNMYWKIDGACGMLCLIDGQLCAFERQDTRGKPPSKDLVRLPSGQNKIEYGDKAKPHTYFMQQIALCEGDGKKHKKIKTAILDILDKHRDDLIAAIRETGHNHVSIEFVGQKFQKTPGVDAAVGIVLHNKQAIVDTELPRTFEQMRLFLNTHAVEGIVVEWKQQYWKVRANLIDPDNNLFENEKSTVMAPLEVFLP